MSPDLKVYPLCENLQACGNALRKSAFLLRVELRYRGCASINGSADPSEASQVTARNTSRRPRSALS